MIGCTDVKLRSADAVQLNHDSEPWLYVLDADWSDLEDFLCYVCWDFLITYLLACLLRRGVEVDRGTNRK